MSSDNYNKPVVFNSVQNPELAEMIKRGAVGILPTDTVYGLVCAAGNRESVQRLYSLKSRDEKPGTLLGADIDQFVALGIKRRYLKAVEHLWPNPLSIVIPCPELDYLHLGKQSLALRIPADEELSNLLRQAGPLQTTSANLPDEPTAATIKEAREVFGGKVDFYIDGGDLSGREPSTVITIEDDAIKVLRPGACKIDEFGRIDYD